MSDRPGTEDFYDEDDGLDDEEPDEFDCSGWFDGPTFVCESAGSEECDFECPYRCWLGLTKKQIDELEEV